MLVLLGALVLPTAAHAEPRQIGALVFHELDQKTRGHGADMAECFKLGTLGTTSPYRVSRHGR